MTDGEILRVLQKLEWTLVEWHGPNVGYRTCRLCLGATPVKGQPPKLLHAGHKPGCRVAAAIAELRRRMRESATSKKGRTHGAK